MEKEAENVYGVDDEKARLQPQKSPKRTGNIFSAELKYFILKRSLLFLMNYDHFPSYSKGRHKT